MQKRHHVISAPITVDRMVRARLLALMEREGVSTKEVARRAGWDYSATRRRLHLDPDEEGLYRRLHTSAVDVLLQALRLPPHAVLVPVLRTDVDRALLTWVGQRSPPAPLPSTALVRDLEAEHVPVLQALLDQGLLVRCCPPDTDEEAQYLRLTDEGLRALSLA